MKRVFVFLTCVMMTIGAMAGKVKEPTVDIRGDLSKYQYVYVIPVSGDKPAPGVPANNGYVIYSRNLYPSDVISGYLMKYNYTIMPECSLENADKTLIVSYGVTGRRMMSWVKMACTIIIQMSDAQTHEIVATFETEGSGIDEVFAMLDAIYTNLTLFDYSRAPRIKADVAKSSKSRLQIELTNETTQKVSTVDLKITYLKHGEIVHEQTETVDMALKPIQNGKVKIKRDKAAQEKDYQVQIEVFGYK